MGSSSSSDGLRLRPTAPVLDEPREEEGPPGYWDYGRYNYGGCGYSDPYYVPWGGQFPQLRQGVLDPTDLPTVVPQQPPHPHSLGGTVPTAAPLTPRPDGLADGGATATPPPTPVRLPTIEEVEEVQRKICCQVYIALANGQ